MITYKYYHINVQSVSYTIRDSYTTHVFKTIKGLIGYMEESGIPKSTSEELRTGRRIFESGRWKGHNANEVFSFSRNTSLSINRAIVKERDYQKRRELRKEAQENMTRIDINLDAVFPSITLDEGIETRLVSDCIEASQPWRRLGFVNLKEYTDFFDSVWGHPKHVLVGLDAESDDDFLIAYALTTSPPSGWYDQESMSVSPEFMDENGEMIRGKLNFVIVTMKLDIKNRLREISRKRIKKTPDESVQSPPICPSCNAELSIGANFCQICGAKLD